MSLDDILTKVAVAEKQHKKEQGSVKLIAVSKVQPIERIVQVLHFHDHMQNGKV